MGEQKVSDIPGVHYKSFKGNEINLDPGTGQNFPLFLAEEDMEIVGCSFIQDGEIIGDDDDNMTLKLVNWGIAASKLDTIAEKTFVSGEDYGQFEEIPLDVDSAKKQVLKGEAVCWEKLENGAGMLLQRTAILIRYKYQKPATS